ncbi:MBL fold metallo-hydrolase [Lysobacter firmicutimachus]|uniref:MBL fold metallo-hydrolase n=1 Tax=Lysobacter firmicutimachus TaxID=1792846 RepID=A0AAU8MPR8_9GAMM
MPLSRLLLRTLLPAVLLCAALPGRALDLPQRWVHGAAGEPTLQVQAAAPGLWVLRQSKRSNFEAPFLYLIAGERRALLLDSGAEPVAGSDLPLRATVDALLAQWQREHGRGETLPLVVAHTHSHRDHTHGDAAFRDRPQTHVVGRSVEEVAAFFGLTRWPEGEAGFDLGGRELRVLPLPGHDPAHIAVYDPPTRSLFSGDSLYPGLLTVRDLNAYRASAARLEAFARRRPVAQVLGAHVEMSARPGELYPIGTALQPDEHGLALDGAVLRRWRADVEGLGDFLHQDTRAQYAFARVPHAGEFADAPNTHGMLVAGVDTVYLSHLPMLHSPHDYQLIFEAELPAQALASYRDDAGRHPQDYYTLAPSERWALVQTIKPEARFRADLYRGHFERDGTPIAREVEVTVRRIVHFRRFEPGRRPDPGAWIAFGRGRERFLAHRIEGAPDMDQIVRIDGDAAPEGQALRRPQARGSGELRVGDGIGRGRVERVLYTEYGDLAR